MSSLEFPSSRPECQLAQTNLLYQHHGCGVKTSQAQTMDKLGLVSPAYTSGRSGSKGIIGGVGYLSPTYTTLLPATGSRNHDSVAAHTHARSTSVGGPMRSTGNRGGSSSSTSRKGGITHEDLEYLKENEKRNQEAWEAWSRARDSDNRQQKNAALRYREKEIFVEDMNDRCIMHGCLAINVSNKSLKVSVIIFSTSLADVLVYM